MHVDRTLHALRIHRFSVCRRTVFPVFPPPRRRRRRRHAAVTASPFRADRLISECTTALGASWWDYRGCSAPWNRSFQSGGIDAGVWRSWVEQFSRRTHDRQVDV